MLLYAAPLLDVQRPENGSREVSYFPALVPDGCVGRGGAGGGAGFAAGIDGFLEITGLGFQDFLLSSEFTSVLVMTVGEMAVVEEAQVFGAPWAADSSSRGHAAAWRRRDSAKNYATRRSAFSVLHS